MKRKRKAKIETVTFGNVAVKIYKRERRNEYGERLVFEVSDYTNGTRRLRSFSDHTKARQEAEKIAMQLSTGDALAGAMRSADAASYGRAMELLRPTGASLELACATFASCFETLGSNRMQEAATFYQRHGANAVTPKPVADVVAELIGLKENRGASKRYVADLRQRLSRFANAFAVDISSVTTAEVQQWLDRLKLSPTSVKNFRRLINVLFSFAESRGYIFKGGNPVVDVETVTANGGSIEIFTPDELAKLLEAASPDFAPFLAVGAFCGLRTAELQRLDWRDVDTAAGFVTVAADKAKTKARRLVPIQSSLAAWLATCEKRTGFLWKGGRNDLDEARAACVKASGVAWKANGLRHSFASYRLAQIQNASQVALEMGNSPTIVFKHYRELVRPAAAAAWFAVVPKGTL